MLSVLFSDLNNKNNEKIWFFMVNQKPRDAPDIGICLEPPIGNPGTALG